MAPKQRNTQAVEIKTRPYRAGRLLVKLLFGCVARVRVLGRENANRAIGLFPEGGIRDGARSLLEGAPLRWGAATLAHMAGVPILPCVILGSDRLYSGRHWVPFRHTLIWIAFGKPISHFLELQKSDARARIALDLAAAFKNLYAELRETFQLTEDDLPHSPKERMKHCRASASLAADVTGNRSGCPTIRRHGFRGFAAR